MPDVRGLFYDVFQGVVGRLDLEITFVQLTEHPMLVEGLVVDQSPGPPAKIHRRGELTVQVWHPPAQTTEDPPGSAAADVARSWSRPATSMPWASAADRQSAGDAAAGLALSCLESAW